MKNQKGITLIALVITIIVLLILAGVTISLTVGQNGALSRAREAVDKNELGTASEELNLAASDAQMAFMDAWSSNQHANALNYYGEILAEGKTSTVYSNNCTKAITVEVAKKEAATTPADPSAPADQNRYVYIRYLSPSAIDYYFKMTITPDDSFSISKGISEEDTSTENAALKSEYEGAFADASLTKGFAKGTEATRNTARDAE